MAMKKLLDVDDIVAILHDWSKKQLDAKSDLIDLLEDVLLEFGHKEQILLSRSRICEWLELARRR